MNTKPLLVEQDGRAGTVPTLKWSESRYTQADLIGLQVARFYSNEMNRPFYVAVGDHPGFDISSVDGTLRIEVKSETGTPKRTGNVAIEYFNTELNRPSGILDTTANIWLHLVRDTSGCLGYEYTVSVLRRVVIEQGVIKSNGRNSLCKIIPLDVFGRYAQRTIDLPLELSFGRVS